MVAITSDRPGLLKALGMSGIQPAGDKDWDDVRSLNLNRNQTEIVVGEQLACHSV